eukprot:758827-Hanusia_phi.AAC.2
MDFSLPFIATSPIRSDTTTRHFLLFPALESPFAYLSYFPPAPPPAPPPSASTTSLIPAPPPVPPTSRPHKQQDGAIRRHAWIALLYLHGRLLW